MLARLWKYRAYVLQCTVWSSTLIALCVTATIAVDIVLEGGSALSCLLLGLYLCLASMAARKLWQPIRAEIWPSYNTSMSPPRTAASALADETRQSSIDNGRWRTLIEAGFGADAFARAEAEGARAVINAMKLPHEPYTPKHIAPPNSIPRQRNQPPE